MDLESHRYDRWSHPPAAVLVTSIAQHMGLMAVTLIFPLLVVQAAGADGLTQARYVALSMVALGVSTLLQCWGGRVLGITVGSGYLLTAVFTAAYLPAALAAARSGGLGAVAGLTIAAGLAQIVLSRLLSRLRPFLTIEIVGLVVMMIGIILGIVAFKLMVGVGEADELTLGRAGAALAALATMVGLAVWGSPRLRAMAVLVGLAAGTLVHVALGLGGAPHPASQWPAFVLPVWPIAMPSFEAALLPGFLAGALACALRSFGDIVASQRANTEDWRRPDYPNIAAGVLADGVGTLAAGLLGVMGLNTYSASVGLSVATDVRARRIGLGAGFAWIALAFVPGASFLVLTIPRGVLGAALFFASAFIILSGVAILGQRMLDARRTLVVGVGFMVGLSFDMLPAFYSEHLSPLLQSVVSSSLMLSLFAALALNALFRIGARQVHTTAWDPAAGLAPLQLFLKETGQQAGARADGMERLARVCEEFATVAPALSDGPVTVTTRFDENLAELIFTWTGRPLEPGPSPSLEDGVDDEAAMTGIALLLIGRLSDRIHQRTRRDGRQELVCMADQ